MAPATADLLARAADGRADDLLTNVLLTARCPVVYAPAMHTEMWQHPATRANVERAARAAGAVVVDPDSGRLTGPDSGPGRLPDPAELAAVAMSVLADPTVARRAAERDLAGLTVAVSAGGTREHLDPVRFLGNASSGRMGWALARAAACAGRRPYAWSRPTWSAAPPNVEVERVISTADLAVGDGGRGQGRRPGGDGRGPRRLHPGRAQPDQDQEVRCGGLAVDLVQTTDVLAGLVAARTDPRQVLVGFAAETPGPEPDPAASSARPSWPARAATCWC